MSQYSINELQQLSGIKSHTIRIWEKRYGLVKPQRTKTNIRFYSDDDLKKIIGVSVLNNHGFKISKIANLSLSEINEKVTEVTSSTNNLDGYIDQLIIAMIDLDEEQFSNLLGGLTLKFGFDRTMLQIVYPFLNKIGVLWLTDEISPSQEHFVSNLIRNKLIVAIESTPLPDRNAPKALLYLPENELHEIGLLFYCYTCKKEGYRTYYLGQTVPYPSLKEVCEKHRPEVILSSFTSKPAEHLIQGYIDKLSADFPQSRILLSGYRIKHTPLKLPKNVVSFHSPLEIKGLLNK